MGLTNFPNGISSFGMPIGGSGIPATYGDFYFVDYDNGNDGNTGKSMRKAFKTLAYAYSKVVDNHNDVIVLSANATHALSAMLTIAKSRIHFIGLDSGGRLYGQRAKISLGVTGIAANTATIRNTGTGNTFRNIKFMNTDTVTQSLHTFEDGGEYTLCVSCEFYKGSQLSATTAAELLLNGDSSQYVYCTFGSLADLVADNMIRPCVKLARETITGKVCRDCYFENCLFWKKTAGVEATHIYAAGATDVERMLLCKWCTFINAKLSTAVIANAVGAAASQTEGHVILQDCASVNCTVMAQASSNIYVSGPVPTFATTGIAKAS